ncbi:S-adenosylmethionine:tRNA ribosyltransferase-isomerase [Alicyclobacillus macrosporangiidus]|uniref:S-adenosylmethionine:tRNA ribosyltransferase-isomerase n=1 Tax=Alicyclobacillus macrosporangiidus TaxID=392015 RepID=A0A1I7L089_9BACL|nr:S-adenosylmethionine:tRNA ribosyltransferase-isomerase [Alicyclobacillus macrosporangiidus]SFV02956.1 S-adenosylmethionine:tRNA ribosyltransferase-isomerase [Alicyclobacillus macrosporangiidus]
MTQSALDLNLHLSRPPAPAPLPPEARGLRRDEVRLLVMDRATGACRHARFVDLPHFLSAGDLMVVNTSATIPGRLRAVYRGEPLYLHLAIRLTEDTCILERRRADGGPDPRPFEPGDTLRVVHPEDGRVLARIQVEAHFHPDSRLWRVRADRDLFRVAEAAGVPIQYGYVTRPLETGAFQTLFSRTPGSAEMPSAARPFTHRVLRGLAARGVRFCSLLLHTGVSSHEVASDLARHPVLPEWYHIPPATAAAVNRAMAEGRRVIAVGTTVVRALESAAVPARGGEGVRVRSGSNWTTHLVTPATPPRVVHGLITGMHDNHTSHLALLYAFARPEFLRRAYEEAVQLGYLWHEFGDISLLV